MIYFCGIGQYSNINHVDQFLKRWSTAKKDQLGSGKLQSIVEECSIDAIVVDQLLILVSHLQIFGLIMFRRVSNEVAVMRKKFLKPAPDLYSKFSSSMCSRKQSFIKSIALYFFAWRLGRTQNHCFQNLQTFSTLEIIIGAEGCSLSRF